MVPSMSWMIMFMQAMAQVSDVSGLQDQAVIEEVERIPVSEADRQRGVTHHQCVALGYRNA